MDGFSGAERITWPHRRVAQIGSGLRSWRPHSAHATVAVPYSRVRPWSRDLEELRVTPASSSSEHDAGHHPVILDGSHGEGGGQILRTALTLSLLTGRPFRIVKIRANRDKPGLRPQHQKAVEAAANLGAAKVTGCHVGSREIRFTPGTYTSHDISIDIGTAGSTGLIAQTLHLPLAMRAQKPARLSLTGGTFNPKAPAFPFLDGTWRAYLAGFGMPVALSMPAAGFYPRGGGRLEALVEPATPRIRSDNPRRFATCAGCGRHGQPPRRHRSTDARPGRQTARSPGNHRGNRDGALAQHGSGGRALSHRRT